MSHRGARIPVKFPCAATTQFYQELSYMDNHDIHLVKESTSKYKDSRRKIASTLVRNAANHVAAVTCANFRPVP